MKTSCRPSPDTTARTTQVLDHREVRFVKAKCRAKCLLKQNFSRKPPSYLFHPFPVFWNSLPIMSSLPLWTTMLFVEVSRSYQMAGFTVISQSLLSTINLFPLCWFQDPSVSSFSSCFKSPTFPEIFLVPSSPQLLNVGVPQCSTLCAFLLANASSLNSTHSYILYHNIWSMS